MELVKVLEEFLTEIYRYQDSPVFQTIFIKAIKNLRANGFFVIPSREKKPTCKFETEAEKERANRMKIDTEAALVLPEWLAVLDVENPSFLENVDWEQIATVKTGKGFHIYILREPWMKYIKTTECELRLGENLLTILPGSRFWSEKYQKNVFYRVLNPCVFRVDELPVELQNWLLEKSQSEIPQEIKKLYEYTEQKENSTEETKKIDLQKLKEIILAHYHEGNRQNIIIYLTAWLLKLGCSVEDIISFVYEILSEASDKETKMRLAGMFHTIKKFENGEEVKGLSGLIEIGIPEAELLSCLKEKEENLIEKGQYGEEYVVIDDFLYLVIYRKGEKIYLPIGPHFRILEKRIHFNEKNKVQIKYLVQHQDKIALWDDVSVLSDIERFTGMQIIDEKRYKSWINTVCKQTREVYIIKQTGWHDGIFLHPARQNEKYTFDESHILIKEDRAKYKRPEILHEVISKILEEGKLFALLLVAGIASILIKPLKLKPFMILLTGPAGSGKTLACSFVTHLFYDARDILITANATAVGLELLLKSMKNLPVLIDEGALRGRLNLEELVFMISSGKGRTRGSINLNTIITEILSTVFYTSETLDVDEFKRTGAFRRCIAVSVKDWNDLTDAYSIDEILQVMKKSCGAGVDYIKYIEENITEDELKRIEEKAESMYNIFPDAGNIIKACFASLYFLSLYYKRDFKATEELLLSFFQNLKSQYEEEEKDIVQRFLNRFSEFLTRNYSKFVKNSEIERQPYEIYGKIEGNNVYVLTHIFSQFCKDHGFDRKVLLTALKEKNILSAEENRFRKVVWIFQNTSVYHIILPETHDVITDEELQALEDFLNTNAQKNVRYYISLNRDVIYIEKYRIKEHQTLGGEVDIEEEFVKKTSIPVLNAKTVIKLAELLNQLSVQIEEQGDLQYVFKIYGKDFTFNFKNEKTLAYALGALELYQALQEVTPFNDDDYDDYF